MNKKVYSYARNTGTYCTDIAVRVDFKHTTSRWCGKISVQSVPYNRMSKVTVTRLSRFNFIND